MEGDRSLIHPHPIVSQYQRLTQALQTDPRCAQEVALGRRVGLYRFCGDIGRGNFSRVKLAVHQLTRDKVAIKVVDRGRLDTRALRMLSREVTTLECVHHPHILRLFEVVETLGRVHLVTEWIRGGELYNRISQGGSLKEHQAATLYKQLLLAVKHMHNLGFVHRDIKAENVLLVTEDRIKLADFGFSTQLLNGFQQHLDTFCGSPPYAAPELFSDDDYLGGPVDVWALGILLYFMVVGNMPFRAPTVPALRAAVLKGDYCLPSHLSLPCTRLIQRILIYTPLKRPEIDQLLESQWINLIYYPVIENSQSRTMGKKHQKNRHHWFSKNKSGKRDKNIDNIGIGSSAAAVAAAAAASTTPLIQCNTKHMNNQLIDNFLQYQNEPFIMTEDGHCENNMVTAFSMEPNNNNNNSNNKLIHSTTRGGGGGGGGVKRTIFSGTQKKKIGPMEDDGKGKSKMFSRRRPPINDDPQMEFKSIENDLRIYSNSIINVKQFNCNSNHLQIDSNEQQKEQFTSEDGPSSTIGHSSPSALPLPQAQVPPPPLPPPPPPPPPQTITYDEEDGEFIMTPTCTDNLSMLHSLEIEARIILQNLGITTDMLCKSIDSGPRSDIIGAYRIIVHRLQKEALLAKQTELIRKNNNNNIGKIKDQSQHESTKPKSNRTCAIL